MQKSSKENYLCGKKYWTVLAQLFLQFLQFGLFTFGGGLSIVAQMNKTYVEEKHILPTEDILDITSVGRSLPGTMIGNIAVMFGYHFAGIGGSIACVSGMIIPPMAILWAIAKFYTAFKTNVIIAATISGIRAAVVPIILSTLCSMFKTAFRYPPCYLVAVITAVLYLAFDVSCVWLVCIGVACGYAITEFYERKGSV